MRLLLVGDDPRDALALREALAAHGQNGYRLEHAEGLARGLDRVLTQPPDLLFLSMQDGDRDDDGLRALVALRRKAPEVPVVVLVRPGDEELADLAVKEGAQDWLVKARLDGEMLVRSMRYAMERAHLTRELADAREQLNRLTLRDELTGLYNRRGFSVLAEQQMRLSRRWDTGLLVLVLDVNGLDGVNQRFGRAAGDRLLVEAAQLLQESFRDSDVKARVGGDEFAVLLAGAAEGTCEVVDQRLVQNVSRLNARPGRDAALSLAGGVARWDPSSSTGVAEALATAEHLMLEQKRGPAPSIGGCVEGA
jgi:two-component system, cell cycle response regulator